MACHSINYWIYFSFLETRYQLQSNSFQQKIVPQSILTVENPKHFFFQKTKQQQQQKQNQLLKGNFMLM